MPHAGSLGETKWARVRIAPFAALLALTLLRCRLLPYCIAALGHMVKSCAYALTQWAPQRPGLEEPRGLQALAPQTRTAPAAASAAAAPAPACMVSTQSQLEPRAWCIPCI